MIPGLSPETASSLAPALPRHVPRHRDLHGRCPGHDPLRREGRGSYQPRSNPLPLHSRRFKRLSAVPSAQTWRPGPRSGVLEWPRTPRMPRRLRTARSLTGVVVSEVLPQDRGRCRWSGVRLVFGLTSTVYTHLPSSPLITIFSYTSDLLRLQGQLRVAFTLRRVLQKPLTVNGLPLRPLWPSAWLVV